MSFYPFTYLRHGQGITGFSFKGILFSHDKSQVVEFSFKRYFVLQKYVKRTTSGDNFFTKINSLIEQMQFSI